MVEFFGAVSSSEKTIFFGDFGASGLAWVGLGLKQHGNHI